MKSKKAISFYAFAPVILIIVLVIIQIKFISPVSADLNALEPGKTISNLDFISQAQKVQDNFADSIISSLLLYSKEDFPQEYLQGKGEVCNKEGLLILIDRRKSDSSCENDFVGFEEDYLTYLQTQMNERLSEGNKIGIDTSDVSVSYLDEKKTVKMQINIQAKQKTDVSEVISDKSYDETQEVGNYFDMLKILKNSLVNLETKLSENIRSCEYDFKDEMKGDSFYCKNKITKDYFKSIKEFNNFDLDLSEIQIEDSKFYGIKFLFKEKKSKLNALEFGVVFSNPPLDYPKYTLEQFEYANNVLEINIDQQSKNDVEQYVVLYSYENFFDESAYEEYDTLLGSLETNNNGIPNVFENSGVTDELGLIKYYKTDSTLNINLLSVTPDANSDKRKIDIYQSYDFSSDDGSYIKLESRPIYVFVFAIDSNYNFLINEKKLKEETKSKTPQFKFGPEPLKLDNDPSTTDNLIVKSDILNLQNSVEFQIQGEVDKRVVAYEVYITKNQDSELTPQCTNSTFFCSYTKIPKGDSSTKKYLITSDSDLSPQTISEYSQVIGTSEFSENFELNNAEEYNLIVVPIDEFGQGIYKNTKKEFNVIKNQNRYTISKDIVKNLNPASKKFVPKDKKNPDPIKSISLSSQISSSGVLTISDDPSDLEEIVYVNAFWVEESKTIKIPLSSGQIPNFDSSKKYTLSRIYPQDSFGNSYNDFTYSLQTNQAVYVP